jgi:signal peptidase I
MGEDGILTARGSAATAVTPQPSPQHSAFDQVRAEPPLDTRASGRRRAAQPAQGRAALRLQRKRTARRELALLVVVTLAVTLLARALVVQAFFIPSPSMETTLLVGDRVLVNKLVYDLRDVRRGEIVVFDGTDSFVSGGGAADGAARQGGPFQPLLEFFGAAAGKHDYIKRVIGLPGDRVVCCDAAGHITVNGIPLVEPYLHPGDAPSRQRFDVRVPEGRLWVMGDHRSRSADSRAHLGQPGGGTVPVDKVVGRAFIRVWPLPRLSLLGVPDAFEGFEGSERLEDIVTGGEGGRGTGG